MLKSLLYVAVLLCLDFTSSYSRDEVVTQLILMSCKKEDIKYNINFSEMTYNILTVEF